MMSLYFLIIADYLIFHCVKVIYHDKLSGKIFSYHNDRRRFPAYQLLCYRYDSIRYLQNLLFSLFCNYTPPPTWTSDVQVGGKTIGSSIENFKDKSKKPDCHLLEVSLFALPESACREMVFLWRQFL